MIRILLISKPVTGELLTCVPSRSWQCSWCGAWMSPSGGRPGSPRSSPRIPSPGNCSSRRTRWTGCKQPGEIFIKIASFGWQSEYIFSSERRSIDTSSKTLFTFFSWEKQRLVNSLKKCYGPFWCKSRSGYDFPFWYRSRSGSHPLMLEKKKFIFDFFFHSKASLHYFFCQPRRRIILDNIFLEEKYSLALHLLKMDTDQAKWCRSEGIRIHNTGLKYYKMILK